MKGTEAYEAIILGLGAVQYMAAHLESSRRTFESVNANTTLKDSSIDETVREIIANDKATLHQCAVLIDEAMQLLGDFSNNHDTTSPNDMAATNHAFAFMRCYLEGGDCEKVADESTDDDD